MSKLKLTPWFPGDVKPARPGVYQRRYDVQTPNPLNLFCLWNGSFWAVHERSKNAAAKQTWPSSFEGLPWRGLASKDGK